MTSARRRWRWFPLAVQAAAICTAVAAMPGLLVRLQPPLELYIGDFYQEWASAKNWWSGLRVYEDQEQSLRRWLDMEANASDPRFIRYNAHPPFSVLLTLWSGKLPYLTALAVWHAVSFLSLIIAAHLALRELKVCVPAWLIFPAIVVLLHWHPFQQQLNQGQWNCVLLLAAVGAWIAGRRGWDKTYGMVVGLAGAIKFFPLYLLLGILIQRRWRALAAAVVAFGACQALSLAMLGRQNLQDYAAILPQLNKFQAYWLNFSLHAPAARVAEAGHLTMEGGPRSTATGRLLVLALLLPMIVVEIVRWRRANRMGFDSAFSGSVVAMLMASPLTWDHGMVLLLLPFAIWLTGDAWRHYWRFGALTAGLAAVSVNYWPIFVALFGEGSTIRLPVNAPEWLASSVPSAALCACYLVGICRDRPSDDDG